jgi:hypothetical protein
MATNRVPPYLFSAWNNSDRRALSGTCLQPNACIGVTRLVVFAAVAMITHDFAASFDILISPRGLACRFSSAC